MKKNIYIIAILSLMISSCCKGPYEVAVISISYPNLSSSSVLNAHKTDRNNLNNITDTLVLGELNEQNSYTISIELKEDSPNYILFIESNSQVDTLSEINFSRKNNCKESIKDFHYKFNEELMTTDQLHIY